MVAPRRHAVSVGVALGLVLLFAVAGHAGAQEWVPLSDASVSAHTVSPEVRSLPEAPGHVGLINEIPIRHRPSFVPGPRPQAPDPVLQTAPGSSSLSTTQGVGFDGVSFNGFYPPDANLSVSETQIVQTTNVQFAVYDKTGTLLKGPVTLTSLFSTLGGLCSTNNGGDPIVLWDKISKRWLISQLAFTKNLRTNYVCIAVSQTGDATGAFWVYAFSFARLPDYPKFGVWSSSDTPGGSDYYFSANSFSTSLYFGPVVCAFNGGDLRHGFTPRFACVQGSTSRFSLLPSDHDGATPPATGEANYFVELGTGPSGTSGNTLVMFPFLATWTSTSGSLNNPAAVSIPVAPYSEACSNGGVCIPQPGTTQKVDSLGDRLMYRLAFRKFAGYESLLANHSVDRGDGVVGVRWYEIRSAANGTLASSATVYQQGTFAPADNSYRWMGGIAQDGLGNILLGYSLSSSQVYPSIVYTGRSAGDPLGTMGAEQTIIAGTGAETGGSRWGDYTSLSVDPSDDCTFWYTNEYFLPNSGVSWKTRIASFRASTCSGGGGGGGGGPLATTTSLGSSSNPSTFGGNVTFTATVTPSGAGTPTGTVTFKDGGTTVGTGPLNGSGQATYSTSSLSVGPHSMTATYGGDASFTGSTSPALTQTVNKAPTTTSVVSNLNPSVSGQNVTFTATVTPTSATGSVQFFDGATLLGTSALNASGQATYSTSSLSVGPHSITASYGGDGNFTGSTSAVLTQTVNTSATAINVAAHVNGGVASASSTYSSGFPVSAVNNGDRKGLNWSNGGGWNDATSGVFPDWVQITFNGQKSITEIDVFTLQDNYTAPVDPTPSMTFSLYGITDYQVQYWNGTDWITVPGGSISGNTNVWRQITFAAITTDRIRVLVNGALASYSRIVEIEAWGTGAGPVNVAAQASGGVASASSTYSSGYPVSAVNDGDRTGLNWSNGGGWNDATSGVFPDWVQITFNSQKSITEIDVFTLQDNYTAPVDPTPSMTFSLYGITDYQVQYWNGTDWITVPGGSISGNTLVWRQLTFAPITTTAIRVFVTGALASYSRIVEIEAWGN